MGQTHKKKVESREARLKSLPQGERLLKSALIKKKEGRVMDAAEKHALKMSSEHGEILHLWEKLRTTSADADKDEQSVAEKKSGAFTHKYPVVEQLLKLIEPKFMTHIRTPSVSRVLQSMIKYGSHDHVNAITRLMSEDFIACSTDAYGHFVVMAIIRHATRETFKTILKSLTSSIPQLISHKFGVHVIHSAYSSRWCGAADRDVLIMSVFKDSPSVMKRWVGFPVLEEVLQKNPSVQKRLLTRLFDLVEKLISQKDAVGFPFVQRLAHAFLRTGTREEVSELCDSLRPHIATVAVTREGAPLASLTFSLTHPKKRKEILQSFKDNLGDLSIGKFSAPVIARLFDLLYDAQMLRKYIAGDIAGHIGQLINNEYGYRILMHLLTPHQASKERYLLPNWMEHNLYSVENVKWNRHTWLTGDYEPEEVEICSKPARNTHAQALPDLVRKFIAYASDEQHATKRNHHHTGIIAREVLVVMKEEPLYREALALTPDEVSVLQKLSPASGVKRERTEEGESGQPAKKEKKSSKKDEKLEKTKKNAKPSEKAKRKKLS